MGFSGFATKYLEPCSLAAWRAYFVVLSPVSGSLRGTKKSIRGKNPPPNSHFHLHVHVRCPRKLQTAGDQKKNPASPMSMSVDRTRCQVRIFYFHFFRVFFFYFSFTFFSHLFPFLSICTCRFWYTTKAYDSHSTFMHRSNENQNMAVAPRCLTYCSAYGAQAGRHLESSI